MLSRILIVVMLGAGVMTAGGPEQRAGVWETLFIRSGTPERLRLILEVSNGALGTASQRTTVQASIYVAATVDGSVRWEFLASCGYMASPQVQLAGSHLAFRCSGASLQTATAPQTSDTLAFDGTFDQNQARLSGTLRLGGDEISVKFIRPEEISTSPLSGHWMASGWGETCRLHVYDGSATIDISSNEQSVFGQPVTVAKMADGRFDVSWSGLGPNSFVGSVDIDRRNFQGSWHGRGFHCSDGPKGVFTRY